MCTSGSPSNLSRDFVAICASGQDLGVPPNEPRFSCGRLARATEFYVPLAAIGDHHRAELGPGAPVSCKRWLGCTQAWPITGRVGGKECIAWALTLRLHHGREHAAKRR